MNYRQHNLPSQNKHDTSYRGICMGVNNIKANENVKKDVKSYDIISLKKKIIFNLIDETIKNLNNDDDDDNDIESEKNEPITKQKICSFYPNCRNDKCYFLHAIKNEKKMIKFLDNIISNLDY